MSLRLSRVLVGLGLLLGGHVSFAGDAPSCKPFDRTPACCPHPPPQCCTPETSLPLDDEGVAQICSGMTAKGEHASLGGCNRYYARGERTAEIVFGREPGDAAAFDKRKAALTSATSRVSPATVAQAQRAFIVRELDEKGETERSSVWALVGRELVHVDAEHEACNEEQVTRLLVRAIERMRSAPPAAKPRG